MLTAIIVLIVVLPVLLICATLADQVEAERALEFFAISGLVTGPILLVLIILFAAGGDLYVF